MVRVIAGELKSRRLKTLDGTATRPTSDRLKEALFNLLQMKLAGCSFLDCFAGSGSIGIEALSRGAAFVVFIESSPAAVKVIRQNLVRLGFEPSERWQLLHNSAEAGLRLLGQAGRKFDIVFCDPPYAADEHYRRILRQLQNHQLLNVEGVVVTEHSRFVSLPERETQLTRSRQIRQGDSVLSLFQVRA
jgi:16S rRNA (guanine966-N2)-methyltransferase